MKLIFNHQTRETNFPFIKEKQIEVITSLPVYSECVVDKDHIDIGKEINSKRIKHMIFGDIQQELLLLKPFIYLTFDKEFCKRFDKIIKMTE